MDLKIEVKLDKNTLKAVEELVEALKHTTLQTSEVLQKEPPTLVVGSSKSEEMAIPTPTPTPTPAPTVEVPAPAPTQTVKYTIPQLQNASMQLKDQGRIGDLRGLLAQFGVATMIDLKDEQLDAFAQALRGLGVVL